MRVNKIRKKAKKSYIKKALISNIAKKKKKKMWLNKRRYAKNIKNIIKLIEKSDLLKII